MLLNIHRQCRGGGRKGGREGGNRGGGPFFFFFSFLFFLHHQRPSKSPLKKTRDVQLEWFQTCSRKRKKREEEGKEEEEEEEEERKERERRNVLLLLALVPSSPPPPLLPGQTQTHSPTSPNKFEEEMEAKSQPRAIHLPAPTVLACFSVSSAESPPSEIPSNLARSIVVPIPMLPTQSDGRKEEGRGKREEGGRALRWATIPSPFDFARLCHRFRKSDNLPRFI